MYVSRETIGKMAKQKRRGRGDATRKLTWPEVEEIRRKLKEGVRQVRIQGDYQISRATLISIRDNVTWKIREEQERP